MALCMTTISLSVPYHLDLPAHIDVTPCSAGTGPISVAFSSFSMYLSGCCESWLLLLPVTVASR